MLTIITICQSQTFSEFGIKMGMVSSKCEINLLSQVGGSGTIFNARRNGPTMGIYVRYFDFKFFNIESELYYLQKGGEDKMELSTISQPDGTGEFLIFDIHFDCLQFQTSFRPYINFKKIDLYGIIGGTLNYLIGVRNGFSPKNDFKDFLLGHSIGLGVVFHDVFNKTILIEMLINSDINNIYSSTNVKCKTSFYMLRVGFSLYDLTK